MSTDIFGRAIEFDGEVYDESNDLIRYIGTLEIVEADGDERGAWYNAVLADGTIVTLDMGFDEEPIEFTDSIMPVVKGTLRRLNDDCLVSRMQLGDIFDRRFNIWL